MLPSSYILSSTGFIVGVQIAKLLVSRVLGTKKGIETSESKLQELYLILVVAVALYAIKYAYEQSFIFGGDENGDGNGLVNHYENLGVGRHTRPKQIIAAFKKLRGSLDAVRLHNKEAQDRYLDLKFSYDVLLDEATRNVYNLFGPGHGGEDPRNDELALVCNLMAVYVYFGFCAVMATASKAMHASRIWIMILVVSILILDVMLRVVPDVMEIPSCFPVTMTEYELMLLAYSLVPLMITVLAAVAEYLYVDVHITTAKVVERVMESKRSMGTLLREYRAVVLSVANGSETRASMAQTLRNVTAVTNRLVGGMEESTDEVDDMVEKLRAANSNPFASYYWMIFVAMYGFVYLFQ